MINLLIIILYFIIKIIPIIVKAVFAAGKKMITGKFEGGN